MIVQELNRVQQQFGYLPRPALEGLAKRLEVPLYRVQEVASFYPHYRAAPPPELEVHVCRDMSCHLRGSRGLVQQLETSLSAEIQAGRAAVRAVSCLGRCDRAPALRMELHQPHDHDAGGHQIFSCFGRPPGEVVSAAQALLSGSLDRPSFDHDADLPDQTPNWAINVYADKPREERYAALRRFLQVLVSSQSAGERERNQIIQQALKNAVLLGMGGAGGQAFKKWCEVREAVGERKYVVCNADESEPGTFKDRELLLRTPYLVVEGVLLAGVVIGATQGYIYIRHEYEECIAAVRAEIEWARREGLCGDDLLASGVDMQVEVFVSPGGYICGEQTALIQAIEDKRAEPRNRPPELQTNGLWDMPTLVNNVETLAWTPAIVLLGQSQANPADLLAGPATSSCRAIEKGVPETDSSWYGKRGRPFGDLAQQILGSDADWQRRHGKAARFPGSRLFSVSGDVRKPNVLEVENGITVRDLIEMAGGMRDGLPLKAMALSGPSGGFTPAKLPRASWPRKLQRLLPATLNEVDLLDLQMHINYFRAWDLMLGAGLVVYAADADLVEQALACLTFFKSESCGKCVPCRIGSTKLTEIAHDLANRRLTTSHIADLQSDTGPIQELTFAMVNTAICGLGTVAPNPLVTLLRHFPNEVASYLTDSPT
jgi:formate dehydrogenase beta subunit